MPDLYPSFTVDQLAQLMFPRSPELPLLSVASVPLIAYSLLFLAPTTFRNLSELTLSSQYFVLSYPLTVLFALITGTIALREPPSWIDPVVALLLFTGLSFVTPNSTPG
jgi:solute carrier family 30 (zinc transporter), member 5/7